MAGTKEESYSDETMLSKAEPGLYVMGTIIEGDTTVQEEDEQKQGHVQELSPEVGGKKGKKSIFKGKDKKKQEDDKDDKKKEKKGIFGLKGKKEKERKVEPKLEDETEQEHNTADQILSEVPTENDTEPLEIGQEKKDEDDGMVIIHGDDSASSFPEKMEDDSVSGEEQGDGALEEGERIDDRTDEPVKRKWPFGKGKTSKKEQKDKEKKETEEKKGGKKKKEGKEGKDEKEDKEGTEELKKSGKKDKKKSGKKFSLSLRKKKGKEKKEEEGEESGTGADTEEAEGKLDTLINDLLLRIEKVINPKPEIIDELVFEPGVIRKPVPGTAHRDLDMIYEVTPKFQYVHISFDGEELSYECMEPPLSEAEKLTMEIVQNAFDKMAHSEILLVEEEHRKDALWDRFIFITEIYRFKLTETQQKKFFYYLHKKYMGFDRIDLLMNDPYIEDITCNGPNSNLYVNHRMYGSLKTNVRFEELELNNFVMRMAQAAGRHISVLQPIRDATLIDGSRANLTLGKEVTKRGSTFTIRRFKSNPVSCIDLLNYGTYDATVLAYFWLMIEYKRSVLAAGGTASGKTTTLNALGSFIPPEYKIVSIEDTAEMNLMHPNWTQSITRAGFGGDNAGKSAGDIELFDLLKAALRQRPEYIIVGEVRGAEAGTLFQAISVGHPCMGTIHAGSIQELLSRVESEPMNVPRNLFASVDMVIFNAMVKVGEHFIRRALRIVEIVELDPERKDLITNPVFKWDPIEDRYEFTGTSSLFEDIEEEFGIKVEVLVREMEERARYIEDLAAQGICDYADVARAIRRYTRFKNENLNEQMNEQLSVQEGMVQ